MVRPQQDLLVKYMEVDSQQRALQLDQIEELLEVQREVRKQTLADSFPEMEGQHLLAFMVKPHQRNKEL